MKKKENEAFRSVFFLKLILVLVLVLKSNALWYLTRKSIWNICLCKVKWGEHGMGPMQHWLTTATPFKSQKILFKARALGSNLIHRRLSTSQLPILDPPSPVTWFTSFLSCPPTPYGLPLPSFARFCDIRISSIKIFPSFQLKVTDCITTHQQNSVLLHVLVYVLAPSQDRSIIPTTKAW